MITEETEFYNPNEYPELVEQWEMHEDAHWTHREVRMPEDIEQWQSGEITDVEKSLIGNVLKLWTQSDVNVGGMYKKRLIGFFRNDKASDLLTSFAGREAVHKNAYAHLNNSLGLGESSYSEFLEIAEMAEKHDYMLEQVEDIKLYLAKQILVEGVSLFASFVILFNFSRFGKMKNMCDIVRWSMKDESMHVIGNAEILKIYLKETGQSLDEEAVRETALRLVELEDAFIDRAYELGEVRGLPKDDVKKYIRYVTNYRLWQIGLTSPLFDIEENPIPWVNDIMGGQAFTNFFEREVTDYSKNNMSGEMTQDMVAKWANYSS